jgi:hypothetical protein
MLFGSCTLNLLDVQGRVLKKETINIKNQILQYELPLNLAQGTYFLSIRNDKNHSFNTQFVKF